MPIVSISGPGNRLYVSSEGGGGDPPGEGEADSGTRLVGDEIFSSDMDTSGDGPTYGFDSFDYGGGTAGTEVSTSHNSSGGPNNRPYVRYTITNPLALSEIGASYTLESPYGTPASPSVTWGESLFFRFSFRCVSDVDDMTQKIVVLQVGGPDDNPDTGADRRIIFDPHNDGTGHAWRLGFGGGNEADTVPLSIQDTNWHDLQCEIRFSTDDTTANGYLKVWVDNDDYENPDADSGPVICEWRGGDPGDEYMSFNGYHQGSIASNVPRVHDWADFRIGVTFCTNWHATGAGA